MQSRLILAILAMVALMAPVLAEDKPLVRVPDLTVFNDGMEMIGALSAMGLHGRVTSMGAPSVDQEGKFGQFPTAGTMLQTGKEVLIFHYGKYVPPDSPTTKTTSSTGQTTSGMDAMVAGADQEFIGSYSGTMLSGGAETPITVAISNRGTWSLIVSVDTGTIGGVTGPGEQTSMESGVLTYRLDGASYHSILSVKVNGDELLGALATVLGTGDSAQRTEATLRATRTK